MKAVLFIVLSVVVYNYVVLPVTVPRLELNTAWTEDDLAWKDDDIFWFIQVTDLHISKYVT